MPVVWARKCITIFIILHVALTICWAFPLNFKVVRRVQHFASPYFEVLELFQNWGMFAPNPVRANRYLEAVVTYSDGTQSRWEFGRSSPETPASRWFNARYRKWATDRLGERNGTALLPDAVKFIASQNEDPHHTVRRVDIYRFTSRIPSPPEIGHTSTWTNQLLYSANLVNPPQQ